MITRIGQSTPPLDMVSTFGVFGVMQTGLLYSPTSQAAAARTDYYALEIPTVHVVRRFWWANGATVSGSRTLIAALYADAGFKPGVRLGTTAATAQGTANQVQFAAPAGGDFTISPGLYWIGIAIDATTGGPTLFGNAFNAALTAPGAFQEATTTPPSTATPVEKTNTTYFLCGFSTTTVV